ncbi:MAG TPA: hypothetical protein VLB83_05155 [Candidatus Paceibacterota bacterium]|nr:hypothetical protein [Candidatus Paceibacterota bacterium]
MFDSWFIPFVFLVICIFAVVRTAIWVGLKRRSPMRPPDPLATKRALENPAHALYSGVPVCGRPDVWIRSDGTRPHVALDRTHVVELEDEIRTRNPAAYQGVEITGIVYGGRRSTDSGPVFFVFLACPGGACIQETPIAHVSPLTLRLAKIYAARVTERTRT